MIPVLSAILEVVTFAASIFLIIAGLSKNEKYSANNDLKKKLLIIGIVLLILVIVIGIPDLYTDFMAGYNDATNN